MLIWCNARKRLGGMSFCVRKWRLKFETRITSYNVCYTKLLRGVAPDQHFLARGLSLLDVITSYSIHYTKLYDRRRESRRSRRCRHPASRFALELRCSSGRTAGLPTTRRRKNLRKKSFVARCRIFPIRRGCSLRFLFFAVV